RSQPGAGSRSALGGCASERTGIGSRVGGTRAGCGRHRRSLDSGCYADSAQRLPASEAAQGVKAAFSHQPLAFGWSGGKRSCKIKGTELAGPAPFLTTTRLEANSQELVAAFGPGGSAKPARKPVGL